MKVRHFLGIVLATAALPAVAGTQVSSGQSSSQYQELMSMKSDGVVTGSDSGANAVKEARANAVHDAAQTFAAQKAYCYQADRIKDFTESRANMLDKAFNFSSLLLDGGRVQPPVIQESDASYKQNGDKEAVTAKTTWNILEPAKIVSAAPDWRGYLTVSCSKPLKPNPILIPGANGSDSKDSDEKAWQSGIKSGWKMGIEQANEVFNIGLHRMTRDYVGMMRFWWLSKRGVVSAPILATGNVGITVNGKTLSVDEKVFRLTDDAHWQHPKQWSPVINSADSAK